MAHNTSAFRPLSGEGLAQHSSGHTLVRLRGLRGVAGWGEATAVVKLEAAPQGTLVPPQAVTVLPPLQRPTQPGACCPPEGNSGAQELGDVSLFLKPIVASLSRVTPRGVRMRYSGWSDPNASVYCGERGEGRDVGLETHLVGPAVCPTKNLKNN